MERTFKYMDRAFKFTERLYIYIYIYSYKWSNNRYIILLKWIEVNTKIWKYMHLNLVKLNVHKLFSYNQVLYYIDYPFVRVHSVLSFSGNLKCVILLLTLLKLMLYV